MTRHLETDQLSNQNISSALEIGSYTADADRLICVQAFVDQVEGNDDYVFVLTLQIAGAGSAYRFIPITTAAAASGITAIGGQAILVPVRSGDVVKVYVTGASGDTTTPDTTVRWFELAALRPTTADRTLDVTAGGEVDIGEVKGAGVAGVADFQADVSAVATTSALTTHDGNLGTGLAALNDLSAAEIESEVNDALVALKLDHLVAVADSDDPVDDSIIAKLAASDGDWSEFDKATESLQALRDFWRTTGITIEDVVSGSTVTVRRGTRWVFSLTGAGSLAGRTRLYFTVKRDPETEADTEAILQVEETDGLIKFNGEDATAGNGSLTVDDEDAGDYTIIVEVAETVEALLASNLVYGLKMIDANGRPAVKQIGYHNIKLDVTRAVI